MAKEKGEFIESELYKGKVQIKFFPKSHQYWIKKNGGKATRKSGSTTFIGIKDKSRPLGIWQQQMTADFLLKILERGEVINEDLAVEAVIQNDIAKDEAVDIGQEMHDWAEKYIKFKLKVDGYPSMPPMPEIPEAITGVNGFLAWEKEHKPKYLSSERMVYSKKYDYMGTLDLEAVVDGVHCLCDFKSSNGLYNSVRMQTASYLKADEEERGKKVYGGRWALRFNKYTESEHIRREERKKLIKQKIAIVKGKEPKDYALPPYVAFEAKFLDKEKGMLEYDYDAFLSAKKLYDWDKKTDWYWNPEY